MEEYLQNASQLSFWLTVFTTATFGIFLKWFFSRVKDSFLNVIKRIKIKELQKIKGIRFNYSAVTYQIVKTHSLMLLFSGLCIFYLYILGSSGSNNANIIVVLIKTLPLYIVEIWYLNQMSFTKKLMASVGKVRVTSYLRRA